MRIGDIPLRRLLAFCVLPALVSAGCHRAPTSTTVVEGYDPRSPGGLNEPKPSPPSNEKLTPEQLAAADPCAARLHDLTEAMLMYYVVHRALPDKLQDLQSVADVGVQLQFTCPVGGQPYVYVPAGLQSLGREARIILHDADYSHRGCRWCVVAMPFKPGKAPYMEVILLKPEVFRTYLPISE
jgi:hypothetical protein